MKLRYMVSIVLIMAALTAAGCTGSQVASSKTMSGQYADSNADYIVTFHDPDIIGYIGLNGPGDNQFYGGHYTVDGTDIRVKLVSKEVGKGAFQDIQEIDMILTIVDDTHIKTPGGVLLTKQP